MYQLDHFHDFAIWVHCVFIGFLQLDMDFLPNNFVQGDIQAEGHRHLVFATPTQLALLAKAKTWYMDATFKVVKEPFYQLFSIHAFVKHDNNCKQVPLVFVLMSRRRKKDYKMVWLSKCLISVLLSFLFNHVKNKNIGTRIIMQFRLYNAEVLRSNWLSESRLTLKYIFQCATWDPYFIIQTESVKLPAERKFLLCFQQ